MTDQEKLTILIRASQELLDVYDQEAHRVFEKPSDYEECLDYAQEQLRSILTQLQLNTELNKLSLQPEPRP